jgi:AcrR family transcriptional regulator
MMTETQQPKPGRPRNAQVDQVILDATLHLIAEEGIQGMSLEGVAERAGVGKTTIYRRWPNKDILIIDALRQIKIQVDLFDTGHFRTDIEQYLFKLQPIMADPLVSSVFLRIIGEAGARQEKFSTYFEHFFKTSFDTLYGMIDRARMKGEIRDDYDTIMILELIGGTIFYHMLVSRIIPQEMPFSIERFSNLIWHGLSPLR